MHKTGLLIYGMALCCGGVFGMLANETNTEQSLDDILGGCPPYQRGPCVSNGACGGMTGGQGTCRKADIAGCTGRCSGICDPGVDNMRCANRNQDTCNTTAENEGPPNGQNCSELWRKKCNNESTPQCYCFNPNTSTYRDGYCIIFVCTSPVVP